MNTLRLRIERFLRRFGIDFDLCPICQLHLRAVDEATGFLQPYCWGCTHDRYYRFLPID